MGEPGPGETTFVIIVSPLPAKYKDELFKEDWVGGGDHTWQCTVLTPWLRTQGSLLAGLGIHVECQGLKVQGKLLSPAPR